VTPYYADAWAYGGVPRVAAALCTALARRGHDVWVCTTDACARDSRIPMDPVVRDGVTVRIFPNRSNRLAYDWQVFTPAGVKRFLDERVAEFDVVHIHAHRHLLEVHAARACDAARVPYVLSPNGTAPAIERRILAKAVFDAIVGTKLLARAACVTAVSEAERRQLRGLGLGDARLELLPNPVDLREWGHVPAMDRDSGRRLVLFLGKVTPRKGLEAVVRALARLEPDVHLALAGSDMGGGHRADSLITQLGLEHRIARLGLLRGVQRLSALAAADVVAYPSRDEVFGLVAVEALLCGTPVIVGADSGCADIVRTAGGGLTVSPGDDAALAGALQAILSDLRTWRAAAREAADRLRGLFDADRVAERAETIYGRVLDVRKRACA
jgi:glycosyltransferase involved in cell wall biosynthesis